LEEKSGPRICALPSFGSNTKLGGAIVKNVGDAVWFVAEFRVNKLTDHTKNKKNFILCVLEK
jgi:hypothetical protein